MTKRDLMYAGVALAIICSGLAYEGEYAIVVTLITYILAELGTIKDIFDNDET